MFNEHKWKNINLEKYKNEIFLKKKYDNSIISKFDIKDYEYIKIINNLLNGIPFAIKDNFSTKKVMTTSASKIIKEFIPAYDSTVFTKLVENGGIPLFKSNLDELAIGSTGLTSNYGDVCNPFDKEYIVGGSSSGSNYLVADGTVSFSIGSDTGDSVRKPAAYTGIIGFKPTWGIVSRFGLYDFAPTFDTVGWFTNIVKESALLLDVLQGFDEKDYSSIKPKDKDFLKNIDMKNEKYKIVVIPVLEEQIINKEILKDYKKAINLLKEDGHKIIEANDVEIRKLSTILSVYRVISSIEAFSCNSNLTGFNFGDYFDEGNNYEEKIINARTKGFGYEVKKRFLWSRESIYSEEKYYFKAIKLRTLINEEINRILSMGDVLMIPGTADLADNINNINNFPSDHLLNNFLTIFNSNGSPSLTMPITKNNHLSTTVNISSLPFHDKKVFKLSNRLEELL
ncbi:MAG: Asp-tRNA(Asn)/Glu-tRNA(Gln) amidotransferase subunit GatA [Mycoplasmataceae bacterium]|nr:Asp-tRNA(Asn)/Glu-tRNA(Gln) amidotransferase subunit GatA [Mycoplasmataceae bacterium]